MTLFSIEIICLGIIFSAHIELLVRSCLLSVTLPRRSSFLCVQKSLCIKMSEHIISMLNKTTGEKCVVWKSFLAFLCWFLCFLCFQFIYFLFKVIPNFHLYFYFDFDFHYRCFIYRLFYFFSVPFLGWHWIFIDLHNTYEFLHLSTKTLPHNIGTGCQ